jgi:methionyl-tRNA synthetase
MGKVLIAVAWPYASGPRHIGHAAGVYIPADIFARYHRMRGDRVLMVSGSDQHGTPVTVAADQEGVSPEVVAERYHRLHEESFNRLGISFDLYWKTSASGHKAVAQDVFSKLLDKGYIYEEDMFSSYCPSCERFMPDRYIEGECPYCHYQEARGDQCENCGKLLDPFDLIKPRCKVCGSEPERRRTRHFFLRLSAFEDRLREYLKDKGYWKAHVLNFTLGWLKEGLKDRPVTRDLDWGVEVPLEGYEGKRIYVWFEAVIGYLSTSIEWARRKGVPDLWRDFWHDEAARHYYFLSKDNVPFHTIVWPSILMGYDEKLNLPYDVPANQYVNIGGGKMSTSRRMGAFLPDLLREFDPDAIRYYCAAIMPELRDTDFSWDDFAAKNNEELLAVYGNFVHRVLTFTQKNFGEIPPAVRMTDEDERLLAELEEGWRRVGQNLEYCHFKDALREIMQLARKGNQYFDSKAPWDSVREDREACGTALHVALRLVKALAVMMAPYLPFSSDRIWGMLGYEGSIHDVPWDEALGDVPAGQALTPPQPLFRRIELPEVGLEEEAERLDVRVGRVLKVENHPRADKLYLVEVDLGTERRRLVAGLRDEYRAEEIEGRNIVVLCNLKPATLRGIKSEGMLLAAVDGDEVSLLLAGEAAPGTQVLGNPGAPQISFEEFRKLKIRVDEGGKVRFFGTLEGEGIPLKAGEEDVTVDRPVEAGSEVT